MSLCTRSQPEHVDSSESNGVANCPGELVMACGDATEVFLSADRRLDAPALLVRVFVMAIFDDAVLFARNDRPDATVAQPLWQSVSVAGVVGDEALAGAKRGEQHQGAPTIAVMTGGHLDDDRPADEISSDIDSGRPAAPRDINRLILSQFSWGTPAAERWLFT